MTAQPISAEYVVYVAPCGASHAATPSLGHRKEKSLGARVPVVTRGPIPSGPERAADQRAVVGPLDATSSTLTFSPVLGIEPV